MIWIGLDLPKACASYHLYLDLLSQGSLQKFKEAREKGVDVNGLRVERRAPGERKKPACQGRCALCAPCGVSSCTLPIRSDIAFTDEAL